MHPSYESGSRVGRHDPTPPRRIRRPPPLFPLIAFASLALGGCAGYTNWPGETKAGLAEPSTRPNGAVMVASLRWTVDRFPPATPDGRYALNLPVGLGPRLYEDLVEKVGPGAEPVLDSNRDLPTYHVKSIRIRGRDAEVMVLRPVTELGRAPEGKYAQQPITLHLRGSLGGWRVTRSREWSVGLEEPPELHVLRWPDQTGEGAFAQGGAEPEPADQAPDESPPPLAGAQDDAPPSTPPDDARTTPPGKPAPRREGDTIVEVIEIEEPGGE